MTPTTNTVENTYDNAPCELKNILVSRIMELSNKDCKDIISVLKERNKL